MKLNYGKEEVQLILPEKNILKILNSEEQKVLLNPEDKLNDLLKNPMGSPSLRELIQQKGAKKILIIVNDITRPTPYEVILPHLLDELHQIGIKNNLRTFSGGREEIRITSTSFVSLAIA